MGRLRRAAAADVKASLRLRRPRQKAGRHHIFGRWGCGAPAQNALKVMMVRVSWMPGMTCTFSLTKWPMSVSRST